MMERFKKPAFLSWILLLMVITCTAQNGCEDQKSDKKERMDVERGQAQLVQNQPAPIFQWSLERHIMIQLYEARNKAITTYSYVQSQFTGKITWECVGIGFPIAATTQLTNPMKMANGSIYSATLPQAEPNGMYAPPQSDATFVPCVAPNGEIVPARIEDKVNTFFQPMEEVGGKLIPVSGVRPSFTISKTAEKS